MRIPSPPQFGRLRLASPADIFRIGIVMVSGAYYVDNFSYIHVNHRQYPQDTLDGLRNHVADLMKDPNYVLLVAVDKYETNEATKTGSVISEDNGWQPPEAGEEVVVGFAAWRLEDGSKRKGHFQSHDGNYPEIPQSKERDKSTERLQKAKAVSEEAEKLIDGFSELARMVVHPAYWRRGHGSTLCRWGVALADVDGVTQGVQASSMGEALYSHLGFQTIKKFHLSGEEDAPQGITLWVQKYVPRERHRGHAQEGVLYDQV